jgi:hypothetical protein
MDEEDERRFATAAKRQKASHHDEPPYIDKRAEVSNAVDTKEQDDRALGFVTAKQKWVSFFDDNHKYYISLLMEYLLFS